jgi:Fe-S oxidoreductase
MKLVNGLSLTAKENIRMLKDKVNENTPLVGIEPSTILTFRDEYPDLADAGFKDEAEKLASNALLFEEFFMKEVDKGNISPAQLRKNYLK